MSEFLYREAVSEDLQSLVSLYLDYGTELKEFGLQYDIDPQALPEVIAARIKSRLFFVGVAENRGQIAAFVFGSVLRLGREYICDGSGSIGYINDLYVQRDYRRSACGSQLLVLAEDWFRAKDIATVEIKVLSKNSGGLGFWQQQNFAETGYFLVKTLEEK